MKAKLSICLLCLLFPVLLQGQEIGLLRMNLDTVGFRGNAAIWGGAEEGGYKPIHEGTLQVRAGAETKVVNHGKKSSWTGALSFEQLVGKNMYSSMLLEPDYFPLDIVEYTKGTKSRQSVNLEAGFLSDIGYEWAAGLKVSARGAYTSKNWNLTHKDLAMALQAEPTLTYVMDDDMGLVTTYIARLRTENLRITEEVEGDAGYSPFLDKGLRYGTVLGANAFQIQEFAQGFSEMLYNPDLTLGLEMVWKRGKTGNGQFQYPGSTLKAFYEQMVQADEMDHIYSVTYQRERDQLKESSEDAFRAVSDRVGRSLGLKYESRFLHGVFKTFAVALDGSRWSERSTIIPNFQDQIKRYNGTATLSTSLSYGIIDLDLNFLAAKGWWKDRGLGFNEDAGSITPVGGAVRQTESWLRKMDYLMASRMGMGGTLTCRIPPVKGLYVQLYGYWHHAFNVTRLPGKNREIGKFTIGYNF